MYNKEYVYIHNWFGTEFWSLRKPSSSTPIFHFSLPTVIDSDSASFDMAATEETVAALDWRGLLDGAAAPSFPSRSLADITVERQSTISVDVHQGDIYSYTSHCPAADLAGCISAAWGIVLSHHTESNDTLFGLRFHSSTTNPDFLPMRIKVDPVQDIAACVATAARTSESIMSSRASLSEISSLSTDATSACKFQTAIEVSFDAEKSLNVSSTNNDCAIVLVCTSQGNEVSVKAEFDERIVPRTHMRLLLNQLEHFLWQILSHPRSAQKIQDLDTISPAERRQLLHWNRPLPPKLERCIHHLVHEHTRLQPDAPAVHAWDGVLSYAELHDRSNQVARRLVNLGVQPSMYIPFIFEKSFNNIVAFIGIIKAGGCAVPLDPSLPTSRMHKIIEDTKASILITSRKQRERAPSHVRKVVVLDKAFLLSSTEEGDDCLPNVDVKPSDPLYVIFTSGSTGNPKGILISHTAFATSAKGFSEALRMNSGSRVLQYASHTFDISILEILGTLTVGGCICIPSDEERYNDISKAMIDLKTNWAMLTPSVAALINPADVPDMKLMSFGGEWLSTTLSDTWAKHCTAINVWGPAECSVVNTVDKPRFVGQKDSSLGRPVNCAAWIVDDSFERLCPLGTVGEICLEGNILAEEYLGDPEKTAKAFYDAPGWLRHITGSGTGRVYRTGDLGRIDSDGRLHWVARRDLQVKINGQRVELQEIEHQILERLGTSFEVVVELLSRGSAQVLIAFVAAKESSESKFDQIKDNDVTFTSTQFNERDAILERTLGVAESLKDTLPKYMLPKTFIPLKRLPKTPNGKTDRKQLRVIAEDALARQDQELTQARGSHLSQMTDVEKTLCRLWAKILRRSEDSITPEDDFFKLGGDSIGAIKVVGACRKEALKIDVATIFQKPRLCDMAKVVSKTAKRGSTDISAFSLLPKDEVPDLLAEAAEECEIDKSLISDLYPVTPLQEGLMAANMTRPNAYTARFVHLLPEDVDIGKFKSVWEKLYSELPILRSRFVVTMQAGSLQAVVNTALAWRTATDLEDYLRDDEADNMLPGLALSRFALVRSERENTTHFVWTFHHMLYDGWSISVICRRFNALYTGKTVNEPEDYRPFVQYVKELDRTKAEEYWRAELSGATPSTFPISARPGYQPIAKRVLRDSLDLALDPKVGITMSTLVRGAWAIMISKFSHTNDVVFGAVVSGRSTPIARIEEAPWPTLATVPLRYRLEPDVPLLEMLRKAQDAGSSMMPYEQTGMQHIRSISDDTKLACDFQNLLVIQHAGEWDDSGPLGQPIHREEETTFPVTCEVRLRDGGMDFATHVDEVVTSTDVVERAINTVKRILRQLASLPVEKQLMLADLYLDSEVEEISQDLAQPRVRHCVHDLISEVALEQPGAMAVCSSSASLSYMEMHTLSSRLATHLLDSGLKPGSIVPLCFEKSIWTVVAMLGVMKAGCAFVALDARQPFSRLQYIVTTVQAPMVLTSTKQAMSFDFGLPSIVVAPALFDALPSIEEPPRLPHVDPGELAYIIFTSGSTGTPKGVMISHSAYATSAAAHAEALCLQPKSRTLQYASYSFDASLVEMLTTLLQGGCVFKPTEEERTEDLCGFINKFQIGYSIMTPSVARILSPGDIPSLKTIVLVGEPSDEALVMTWINAGAKVVNGYGPTECSICASAQVLSKDLDCRNIGKAVGGTAWIVDPDNHDQLVGEGEKGELVMEGYTLARGYLNDPERTHKSFIEDPVWARLPNATKTRRMYKTGDLVQSLPDGSMLYLGRADSMVKVNGQRVELGEIEHHLMTCHIVERALVILPQQGSYKGQLTAVISIADSQVLSQRKITRIRSELTASIPSYMIPTQWIDIHSFSADGSFPLSPSGKLDRMRINDWIKTFSPKNANLANVHSLLTFEGHGIDQSETVAWKVCQNISSMLPTGYLVPSDGLYPNVLVAYAGLDSLNMITLIHSIKKSYGVRVPMQLLMDKKTSIRKLARFVSRPEVNSQTHTLETAKVDMEAEIQKHDDQIKDLQISNITYHDRKAVMTEHDSESDGDGDIVVHLDRVRSQSNGNLQRIKHRGLRSPRTVLLTGATGFLGIEILRQLLGSDGVYRVVTLVRGSDLQEAMSRLVEAASKALWDTVPQKEKLEIWPGDLSQPNLGLADSHWHLLTKTSAVDTIIHNGAVVHWTQTFTELEPVNILSTMQLLQLAVAERQPEMIFVSGGRQWLSENERDEDVAEELSASSGYSQTKFVSEVVVKRAAQRSTNQDRRIAVVKPGIIIGTAVSNIDDFIWRLVAACVRVKSYSSHNLDSWICIADVTTTASLVVDTAMCCPSRRQAVTHMSDGLTWRAFWQILRDVGYDLAPSQAIEWKSVIQQDLAELKEKHPLWPVSHMLDEVLGNDEQQDTKLPGAKPSFSYTNLETAVMKNVEFLGQIGFIPLPNGKLHSSKAEQAFSRGRRALGYAPGC